MGIPVEETQNASAFVEGLAMGAAVATRVFVNRSPALRQEFFDLGERFAPGSDSAALFEKSMPDPSHRLGFLMFLSSVVDGPIGGGFDFLDSSWTARRQ